MENLAPDPKLYSATNLAKALGVNRSFVGAMKRDGFPMPGGRSTIAWAHEWLRKHPNFTVSTPLTEHSRDDEHQPGGVSDKWRELPQRNAPRIASSAPPNSQLAPSA